MGGQRVACRSFANMNEFLPLYYLTTLEIHIENFNFLFKDFDKFGEDLKNFIINVGACSRFSLEPETKAIIIDMRNENIAPTSIGNWAKALLKRTQELRLLNWKDLQRVEKLNAEIFNCLSMLYIDNCGNKTVCSSNFQKRFVCLDFLQVNSCLELEVVFHSDDPNLEKFVLPCLEKINLENLPKLISIWKGIDPNVFQNLRFLSLLDCPGLLKLFKRAYAETLKQLYCLKIQNCVRMITVISDDEDNNLLACRQSSHASKITFPSLKNLALLKLPNLTSFIQPQTEVEFPSLDRLSIKHCPKLKQLPCGPQRLSTLNKLEVDGIWFEEMTPEDGKIN